jgi:hypothetical protein
VNDRGLALARRFACIGALLLLVLCTSLTPVGAPWGHHDTPVPVVVETTTVAVVAVDRRTQRAACERPCRPARAEQLPPLQRSRARWGLPPARAPTA